MEKIDKIYNQLLKLGYEPFLLQSLTDKELKDLYSQNKEVTQ